MNLLGPTKQLYKCHGSLLRSVCATNQAVCMSTESSTEPSNEVEDNELSQDALRRKRRTEYKRRQGGQSFLDHVIVHVRGGRGGDGCVAFHREKFKPYGPPSGGNGGRGADVYIQASPHLTTLSSVPTRIRGPPGGNGQGTWQHGKNAPPLVIKVPLGTIVRELPRDDLRRSKDEYEAEAEALEELDPEERKKKIRERRWVHYPMHEDENVGRDTFRDAERALVREERERRWHRRQRQAQSIYLDLDRPDEAEDAVDPNAPLGSRRHEPMGHLIAAGGTGGVGNPHFLSAANRSPKFATRGCDGERVSLSLELKLLADVGLVGMPNAGKSTLLRALSGGRARTEVAGYAFTTLNPVVAVIRVADDGSFDGSEGRVYDETRVEEQRDREMLESGALADAATRNQRLEHDAAGEEDRHTALEAFRFTVADNPGLIEEASLNVGLGHSFLRSIERSHALVYVVDLSSPAPWDDLRVLRDEIEMYKPGISPKARMVLANKADLLGGAEGQENADAVLEAREKLRTLEAFVEREMAVAVQDVEGNVVGRHKLDVVPISAKYSMNLRKVVGLMRGYVEEARTGIQAVAGDASSDATSLEES